MTDLEVLQAGFQERGHPGEVLGGWMRREISERSARGEQPPWNLGPTVPAIWKEQAEAELSQRIIERDGLEARFFEMQNAAIDLAKDNTRLRALIKEAEYARGKIEHDYDSATLEASCPWCDSPGLPHRPDCRAFTIEGEVR